ncbi:uncharacterized protein LOC127789274 isoform X1 [Diospyros lotus]|uniref:uncharacterized protein LOC127789274 isoform X1 n=1 Tax=Diospyros lotus TaxID=55363 RepID=UPI002258EE0A|nr:uncharacterized protein LOC127789274 isoform X1 [Diospyros lotus]
MALHLSLYSFSTGLSLSPNAGFLPDRTTSVAKAITSTITTTTSSVYGGGGQGLRRRGFHSPPSCRELNHDLSRPPSPDPLCASGFCSCGRRHFIEAIGTSFFASPPSSASTSLFAIPPSSDSTPPPDPTAMLNSIHPPRPDWYEEFYASVLDKCTKPYEAEIAGYKSQLFNNLRGKAETVLEIGIGTGPNIKYYASDGGVHIFGIDPNRKMEKYALKAAVDAGLQPTNFKFIQAKEEKMENGTPGGTPIIRYLLFQNFGRKKKRIICNKLKQLSCEMTIMVAEALPLSDASVDAVVGSLVLCSVKDVDMALKEVRRVLKPGGLFIFVEHVAAKDGTILRFVQGILTPLQQMVSDGCHLTRKTGKHILEAGFSNVDINTAFLSSATLVNPHIYGIACK